MIDQEIKNKLEGIKVEIAACTEEQKLKDLYASVLGRKGIVKDLMAGFRNVPNEDKKAYGAAVNAVKEEFTSILKEKQEEIVSQSNAKASKKTSEIDLMIPMETHRKGTLHPLTLIEDEVIQIFKRMGFSVVSGPEMESDYYNFKALNIPDNHPARDMQDTFWFINKMLLRTHTSPCQVRAIENIGAPLRVVAPGRVFRNESLDASHENTFHQVEGMIIDKDMSIANLIYIMKTMLSDVFGKELNVRLRPGYFPFVEPGFELDCSCLICNGSGCSTCSQTGWIELVPCGMIHNNVLEMSGIDPNEYTGFAFGLGMSRLAMMKYNIADIRVFNRGDVRELSNFDTFI